MSLHINLSPNSVWLGSCTICCVITQQLLKLIHKKKVYALGNLTSLNTCGMCIYIHFVCNVCTHCVRTCQQAMFLGHDRCQVLPQVAALYLELRCYNWEMMQISNNYTQNILVFPTFNFCSEKLTWWTYIWRHECKWFPVEFKMAFPLNRLTTKL